MTRPTRILVVDDDFATRLLACEALEAEGFTTSEAENGDEALASVESSIPEAVLLDVNMPGIDGYAVCRSLRARADGEDISIMVMTATDDRDAVERAFAAGATDFMTKPLNLPLLGHRIRFMQRAAEATAAAREAAKQARHDELRILQLAYYDELMGIPNARFVDHYLTAADVTRSLSAIAIDLGVAAVSWLSSGGRDALLRAAASRVLDVVCGSELRLDQVPCAPASYAERWLVARTGIDDLTVIHTELGSASAVARKIATVLAIPFTVDGRTVTLHARFGIAEYPDQVTATSELHTEAVYALRQAMPIAPRDIVVFGDVLRERRTRQDELARQLGAALDDGISDDLVAMYAPRRDLSRALVGVRIEPVFVPLEDDPVTFSSILAADASLSPRLARWSLARAVHDAGAWLRAGIAMHVAVELPCSVVLESGFSRALSHAFSESGLTADLLDLELVELPTGDAEMTRVAQVVASLRERGVRVHLARIDVQLPLRGLICIAVDGVCIDHGVIEHRGPRFLATLFAMVKAMGLRVAVGNVDSVAAMHSLQSLEIDEVAGAQIGAAVLGQTITRPRETGENAQPRRALSRSV